VRRERQRERGAMYFFSFGGFLLKGLGFSFYGISLSGGAGRLIPLGALGKGGLGGGEGQGIDPQ
jgi:hypothetical protein